MKVRIEPGRAEGITAAPPSKSYAHRLMICAALADGESTVRGTAEGQDMLATLGCIAAMGARYSRTGDDITVQGGLHGFPEDTVFPCRESGSTLRFFMPIALTRQSRAIFTGSRRLMERGISVYEGLFAEKGIFIKKTRDAITVAGKLAPGEYVIPGDISSQFVSGLLFALPLLEGDSVLRVTPPIESRPYIDMTADVIRRSGISVHEERPGLFIIPGRQRYMAFDGRVEGDWSNGAVLHALGLTGGKVTVTGLDAESVQGDKCCIELLERLKKPHQVINISDCPDLGALLFAAAAALHGAVFTGTRRLGIKESDRAAVMASELKKFGIRADVDENKVTVSPGELQRPAEPLEGHNDHRVVMALALLACITGGEIDGAEAVNKSYPDFFSVLSGLGLKISYNK